MKRLVIYSVLLSFFASGCGAGEKAAAEKKAKDLITLISKNNFQEFDKQFPVMIPFESSTKSTPEERSADIQEQQLGIFDQQALKFRFNDIRSAEITGSEVKLFQYELGTDAVTSGKLIYIDGSKHDFKVFQRANAISGFSIDNVCVFNRKCE